MTTDTNEPLYRIAWRSKITGWTSGGVPCMSRVDAQAEADRLDKQWPDMEHWIEAAPKGYTPVPDDAELVVHNHSSVFIPLFGDAQ